MKNDEMVLRFCEDKSIRLEFFENGQKRTKVISVENADRLYQPEPCRRPPDDRLASGERSKRYDGFGQ